MNRVRLRLIRSSLLALASLAFVIIIGEPVVLAVDHFPRWNGLSSVSYGLSDLDGFDPKGYYYCKWGNFLDYNTFGIVDLSFNWLTVGPYNNSNPDLFITQTPPPLNRMFFPPSTVWTAPNGPLVNGTVTFTAANNQVELYRYLHFRNELTDEITGTPLNTSTKKVVVVFHGWNPSSKTNGFDTAVFQVLLNNLAVFLNGSDWKLVVYHWEADADTGPLDLLTGATNPTEAAEISHQHGQHLGELLHSVSPNLAKVHLIAHSAGAWAARSTLRYILNANSTVKIELTLLDPFMPNAIVGVNSSLGEPVFSQIDSIPGNNRLYLLENYFADEITLGTQEVFLWRTSDINLQVDWLAQDLTSYYDSHDGPIAWYADTLYSASPAVQAPVSLSPFQLTALGWQRSLFFREPLIVQNPQDLTVIAGTPAAFAVSGTSRFRLKNPQSVNDLTFQWQKNGANIPGATSPSLSFTPVTFLQAGDYSVIVSNSAGTIVSATARLTVVPDPSKAPTLTVNRQSAGAITLNFDTQLGQMYRLQATTNLLDWTTLLSTNASGASIYPNVA